MRSGGTAKSSVSVLNSFFVGSNFQRLLRLASIFLLWLVYVLLRQVSAHFVRAAPSRPATLPRVGAIVNLSTLPVFVINGAEDYAARKWVEEQLVSVGVRSYERLNGVMVEADDCLRLSGEGCQQGLALAHLAAWRRVAARGLKAALIVEDDVTWHTDFLTLLPRYMAQVPPDWLCVWLGQVPRTRGNSDTAFMVEKGKAPWTLHAYLLTGSAAELLSRHYEFLLSRAGSPHALGPFPYLSPQEQARLPWAMSFRELKSDYFTHLALTYFVPSDEQHRWVAFASTPSVPARLGDRSWVRSEDNELGHDAPTTCTCEVLGSSACSATDEGKLPVMGTGLAFQNLCRMRRWALHNWVGYTARAKPPTCAWLRERIRIAKESDETPHDCVDDVYPVMRATTPKKAVGGGPDVIVS